MENLYPLNFRVIKPADIPNICSWIHSLADADKSDDISDSLVRLCGIMHPVMFAKRQRLVSEGIRIGYAYFIEKGMTRSFWLVDGDEFTTSFSVEGSIVFSMDEMYYGRCSEEFVEAVEPIEAYAVKIPELMELVKSDAILNRWWITIHQNEYRRLHRSHKERLTLPARDRYAEFARQFPEVCRRARLTDIASYLGISLSTLSRLRRVF